MKYLIFIFLVTTITLKAQKQSTIEIINLLKEGNKRFVEGNLKHPHLDNERRNLAGTENQGDYAYATIISCSDSRVPVEYIFDTGIMDIFVIRIAGNVCGINEIGSIEYGLAHVHTPVLVILGHSQCGAVTAATQEVEEGHSHELEQNIPPLIDKIKPAIKRTKEKYSDLHGKDLIPHAIEENVWQSIHDLFLKSPVTRKLVKSKKVKVIGAIYNVQSGKVDWMNEQKVYAILKKVEKNLALVE